ncbi:STY4534 family ICE replication protein [Erwinia sp.]|uniref:STY4534 family ICE replication protein n=1 Tax=Erwinia citreus TaxID=558 RepID=UPI00289EC530|nr:STY4534 family ICE replication protein [Erwinia sp.]
MSVNNAQSATTTSAASRNDYFNLTIKGLGYLSNVRQVNAQSGTFISCVINALSGPSDSPSYVRFDVTVAGKEASSLINRCQKAVDEDKKVLIGFALSNPSTDIFQLKNGEHAGESRVSLKARLIKVDWIKIGQDMVYKAERSDAPPAQSGSEQALSYADNSF